MESKTHHTTAAEKKCINAYIRTAKAYGTKIKRIVDERGYDAHESALAIATDTKYQKNIRSKIQHLMNAEHVVLVGIGGSSLGTEAIYNALRHTTTKKLTVLDTIDEPVLTECIQTLHALTSLESIAVVVVTKSGNTSETLVNAAALLEAGTEHFGEGFLRRVVFVGNAETSFMKAGKRKKVTCLTIPDAIGGRYSVFTAVGVVPLMLLGIDTDALLYGARSLVSQDDARTAALLDAVVLRVLIEHEKIDVLNFFALDTRLHHLGMWYRQLLAESIGKTHTKKKKPFAHHVLPIVSSSVDFHSVLQLYLSGGHSIFTYFVSSSIEAEESSSTEHWLLSDVPHLKEHSRAQIMAALIDGVRTSYQEKGLPHREVTLAGITPYELGMFIAGSMLEVMTLCHLFEVNAFDQPEVEGYKKYAKNKLTH